MKRLVVITVGKTHSGKTTFAEALEKQLHNSVVIDQDNHAEFINTHYKALLPTTGPNTFKHTITQTIVHYATEKTELHLILCNSNRARRFRLEQLKFFQTMGFITVIVNFDIPDHILRDRVAKSQRSKTIFRSASNFEAILIRQQNESEKDGMIEPTKDEADHFYEVRNSDETQSVIQEIVNLTH